MDAMSRRPTGITVRDAQLEDVPVIAQYNIALAWETEQHRLIPETITRGVTRLIQDTTRGRYWVANPHDQPDRIVGQIMVTKEWSDWRDGDIWWIQSVYVHTDFRGQGIFGLLYDHVRQSAIRDGGVAGLRLYVEQSNDRAQSAYRKAGMVDAGYIVMQELIR